MEAVLHSQAREVYLQQLRTAEEQRMAMEMPKERDDNDGELGLWQHQELMTQLFLLTKKF